MSGHTSQHSRYDLLYNIKKKTIKELCDLILSTREFLNNQDIEKLQRILNKYNAANHLLENCHNKSNDETYEYHHPGYLGSYFKTPHLQTIYLNSNYYQNIPRNEIIANDAFRFFFAMTCFMTCLSSLLLGTMMVTNKGREALEPLSVAVSGYIVVSLLLLMLTNTDYCLHQRAIFSDQNIARLCGENRRDQVPVASITYDPRTFRQGQQQGQQQEQQEQITHLHRNLSGWSDISI